MTKIRNFGTCTIFYLKRLPIRNISTKLGNICMSQRSAMRLECAL